MYLVQLGREFVLPMDTIVEGMTVAVDAFKSGWEVDVINSTTGEVMVSLRDGEVPYFSSSIHEVIQENGIVIAALSSGGGQAARAEKFFQKNYCEYLRDRGITKI